jgi:2-keto-3-deoxy-L-arabinonate dehydratase
LVPLSPIQPPLHGVFPILATCFGPDGRIDYNSQERLIDFCIDAGVHGLVLLANASEGHLMADDEKRDLLAFCLEKIRGRIPAIATVNHPASAVAAATAATAQHLGAAAVMSLPPFFGRWRAGPSEVEAHFAAIDAAIDIPLILQDHTLSDISLPVDFLASLAHKLPRLQYLKLESGNIPHKARALRQAAGDDLTGIFGGNSGVFLPEEWRAGCTGTMPACYMPDIFRRTWDLLTGDDYAKAHTYFAPFSRLAAYEKDVCNRCVWKELLVQRGIIACGITRQPRPAFAESWQVEELVEVAVRAGLL